jgi:2-C-methyl-D-erythritol 2,4-cyclodiphosphate synthase
MMTQSAGIDRVGIGTDLHRLVTGRRLVLGHVEIEHETGCLGHSDGDVVLHAITDAIAGAAGLPDIGEMFPDTEPAYKDADSGMLLERMMAAAAGLGYVVGNVDVTIQAQQPRLTPHKQAIRQEVARLLQMDAGAVSIKAKTNEGIDAIGRGEAIATTAIVGLKKRE